MQNNPERDRPESNVPNLSNVPPMAPGGSPFTDEEWKTLVYTPVAIGRAMMACSPSGGIGMAKEVSALHSGLDATQMAEAKNPMLRQLAQHLNGNMESTWRDVEHVFKNRWDTASVRQTAITASQQAVTLLKKASPQDAMAYKEFVYALAQKVAEASTEGGFLGINKNADAISPDERALLNDVAKTLGIQRS